MRLFATIALLTVVGLVLPAPALAQGTTVTVHLTVETHATDRAGLAPSALSDDVPGTGECDVTVPEDADGGAVLDQATTDGCIDGWDYQTFNGHRFVTEVDDLEAPGYTCIAFGVGVCDWWEHHINGASASFSVDGYEAEDGDSIRWLYRNTA